MRLLTFTGTEAEAFADTITDPNEAQAFRMRWAAVRHAADCLARDYVDFGPDNNQMLAMSNHNVRFQAGANIAAGDAVYIGPDERLYPVLHPQTFGLPPQD